MNFLNYLLEKDQQIKMKATGEVGYLTGKTKSKAGKTFYQVHFPWSRKDNEDYEKFWGKKRPKDKTGRYDWQKEVMFERM